MLQGRADESLENAKGDSAVRDGQVSRRTVVQGAVWSVPVIAVAAAMPLTAASVIAPALKFVNGPYAATGCGPLGDVILNLTSNGTAPDAGKTVTVSLPTGLRWADGTTAPKSFAQTDATGSITIPSGQILGASATAAVLTATSSTGATATAPVTVTPNLVARDWRAGDGTIVTFANPAATSAGWNFFFGPGGKLYHGDTLIASGVSSAVGDTQGDLTSGLRDGVAYVDANGVANIWSWDPATNAISATALPGVPAGARAVGWNFFLTPSGGLYHGNDLIDTGVTSAVGEQIVGAESVTYVTNGQARIYFVNPADPSSAIQRDFPAVPTGAGVKAVGHNFVLTAGGDLYHSSGELVGTGVSAAVGDQLGDLTSGATDGVSYVQGGVAKSYQWFPDGSTPVTTTFAAVPAGATPVGWSFFLAPGGGLYHGDTLAATNVVSAVGGEFSAGVDGVTYVETVAC
ncbi:hypothetical protein SAMN04488591_1008 [Microbacterium azadirachtae]|uniref:Uncharacterized protein n=1 Tax=Microbacterium azadirachtae TaxID=582680 RepID=A0A1I6GC66_9MICO|nr:hypothetical protein [Microbacterium azadirachtae]SFR39804.1 hypothetical protein SAMN04488591_1008 [Microbacterium azadirachtae]